MMVSQQKPRRSKLAPYVFVRPTELRAAEWSEITLDGNEPEWRIPAERMKMREAHIVPLADSRQHSQCAASLSLDVSSTCSRDRRWWPSTQRKIPSTAAFVASVLKQRDDRAWISDIGEHSV